MNKMNSINNPNRIWDVIKRCSRMIKNRSTKDNKIMIGNSSNRAQSKVRVRI
jgi:hypothetical protein